jgi:hypothetical protein
MSADKNNVDDFIKYINNNLKMINKHFSIKNQKNVVQQNNHLYYFTKIGMDCMKNN